MDLFLEKIVSSAAEITLFSALPFVWWAATSRKRESFFRWIGLRKDCGKGKCIALFDILTLLGFISLSFAMLKYINEAATAASGFYGLDFKALPAVFVYAIPIRRSARSAMNRGDVQHITVQPQIE